MNACFFIPSSLKEAASFLRAGWRGPAAQLSKTDFVRAWSAVAYLFPGLHPDGFDDPESGWPAALKRFAAEADFAAASAVLSKFRNPPPLKLGPWTCPTCGEALEGQFMSCWKCGAVRDVVA